MQREAYFCAARSANLVDIVFMPQGLHNEPGKLRAEVQKELDKAKDSKDRPYDAALLGYGLCSNGIVGLSASIPIIVPRGHDCITLLLGSKEKYKEYFEGHRGVYWYSPGWIEEGDQPGKERYERLLTEYRQKYGDDNAEYLMKTEEGWMDEYSRATYVDWGLADNEKYKQFTKDCARYLNWNYDEITGDPGLMQALVDGCWAAERFLTVQPGQKITEDVTRPGIIDSE
jgi:hypothetical protein